MYKYFKFFPYYLEIFAKRLNGKGLMDPYKNGEYKLLKNIIRQKIDSKFIFIDGGSHVGNHMKQASYFCEKYGLADYHFISVEPNTDLHSEIKKLNIKFKLIPEALSDVDGFSTFYHDKSDIFSGQSSLFPAYYHKDRRVIKTTTIDKIIKKNELDYVDFIKLDIEGGEYNALLGANDSLSKGKISYIQLEYTQNWIEGGGTIEKVLKLITIHNYQLFLIRSNSLLSIKKYNFHLDDFFYSNLLIVKNGSPLPFKVKRSLIPI